jgi:hypothetical protein
MNPKRRRGKNTISANFNFWIVVEWLIIIRGLKYEQTQELGKRTNLPLCCVVAGSPNALLCLEMSRPGKFSM